MDDSIKDIEAKLYSSIGVNVNPIKNANPQLFSVAYDGKQSNDARPPMSDTPTRQEVDAKIAASAADTRAEFEGLRADISEFKTEIKTDMASIRTEMARGQSELIKWIVGTAIALGSIGISVMTFVVNNAASKAGASTAATQPIIITVPQQTGQAPQAQK